VVGSHDGRTVTVVFDQPFADWKMLFNDLLPAHVMEKAGWDPMCTGIDPAVDLSGGPFEVGQVVPGHEVVLVRNPRWWGQAPYLERITVRTASGPAQLTHWLLDGTVQVIEPGSFGRSFLQQMTEGPSIDSSDTVSTTFLQLEYSTTSALTGDLDVREALSHAIDRQALVDHLIFGYPLGPKTFFQDVRELPPGHWMRVGPAGAVREGCFWSWQRQERAWDDGEALEAAKETLTRTLRSHLVADVPIAALLSGGVDSSLLVSLLARELGADLQTFTVRFEDSAYDESPYARLVAKHLGIRHHEIEVSHGGPLLDEIQQIMDRFDQPFADSSAIPTFLVSREIRKHAKVAIGGDGGDEMFGGYPRFHYADVAQRLGRLPAGMLAALRWVTRCAGGPLPDLARKAGRVLAAASARGAERLQDLVCYVYPHMLADVLSPAALETVRGYVPGFGADGAAGCCDGRQLIDATVKYALPGDYLRKVDMMSAAHGLEVRVPYLGAAVLDFAATLPRRLKYRGSRSGKLLLRELLRSYVPPAVLRRPKTGFAIPIDRVLSPAERREVHALLCGRDSCIPQFFNSAYLTPLLEAFVSQQWDRSRWSRYMIYQQVYLLWSLDRWLRCWKPSL